MVKFIFLLDICPKQEGGKDTICTVEKGRQRVVRASKSAGDSSSSLWNVNVIVYLTTHVCGVY